MANDKNKNDKQTSKVFAKGGENDGVSLQGAHTSRPGITSTSKPGKGASFASGGKTKMFPQQTSGPAPAGGVGLSRAGKGGGTFAKGGSTKMFGPQHAGPATAGMSVK